MVIDSTIRVGSSGKKGGVRRDRQLKMAAGRVCNVAVDKTARPRETERGSSGQTVGRVMKRNEFDSVQTGCGQIRIHWTRNRGKGCASSKGPAPGVG